MIEIVIDTREQRPWAFHESVQVSRGTLKAGDYALAGDDQFAIERKSLDDFVSTVCSNFSRFNRELIRMMHYPCRIVIVEANYDEIIKGEYASSRIQPKFVMKRITELSFMGVSVLFASDPFYASGLAFAHLLHRHNIIGLENEKKGTVTSKG